MKILFDTNVVLDLMLDRKPFSTVSAQLFSKVESGDIVGFISATTVTTIYYLATKVVGTQQAKIEVNKLFTLFEIAPVNRAVLEKATELNFSDFEDAVIHEAAIHIGVDAIVSRNIKDFRQSILPIYSPNELSKILKSIQETTGE
ncbi:MAG: PIN domain protein [Candidatus Scalindua rubra]|uniref:PIN domain protein n=1 Tax=Candidatus Scalindua rubra TaxID=1872076 RepID=A0A1E3X7R9_9BACT|nr:MAG: PIN domain protein [Candidatus Scalindua rubra]